MADGRNDGMKDITKSSIPPRVYAFACVRACVCVCACVRLFTSCNANRSVTKVMI